MIHTWQWSKIRHRLELQITMRILLRLAIDLSRIGQIIKLKVTTRGIRLTSLSSTRTRAMANNNSQYSTMISAYLSTTQLLRQAASTMHPLPAPTSARLTKMYRCRSSMRGETIWMTSVQLATIRHSLSVASSVNLTTPRTTSAATPALFKTWTISMGLMRYVKNKTLSTSNR